MSLLKEASQGGGLENFEVLLGANFLKASSPNAQVLATRTPRKTGSKTRGASQAAALYWATACPSLRRCAHSHEIEQCIGSINAFAAKQYLNHLVIIPRHCLLDRGRQLLRKN